MNRESEKAYPGITADLKRIIDVFLQHENEGELPLPKGGQAYEMLSERGHSGGSEMDVLDGLEKLGNDLLKFVNRVKEINGINKAPTTPQLGD